MIRDIFKQASEAAEPTPEPSLGLHRILIEVQAAARGTLEGWLAEMFDVIHGAVDSAVAEFGGRPDGVLAAVMRRAQIARSTLDRLDLFWADFALGIPLPEIEGLLAAESEKHATSARVRFWPSFDRLTKRLVQVHPVATAGFDHIPLEPTYLMASFIGALDDHDIGQPAAKTLVFAFDHVVMDRLGDLFDALCHVLARHGVEANDPLPDLKPSDAPHRHIASADSGAGSKSTKYQAAVREYYLRAARPVAAPVANEVILPATTASAEPVAKQAAPDTTKVAVVVDSELLELSRFVSQQMERSQVVTPEDSAQGETDTSATSPAREPENFAPRESVAPSENEVAPHVVASDSAPLEAPTVVAASPPLETNLTLALGAWVSVRIEGVVQRAKLSWRSPAGKMLFVDGQGKKVAQLNEVELRRVLVA